MIVACKLDHSNKNNKANVRASLERWWRKHWIYQLLITFHLLLHLRLGNKRLLKVVTYFPFPELHNAVECQEMGLVSNHKLFV